MKLYQLFATFLFLLFFSVNSHAQRIKLVEGDLSALKGLSALNTEFTYDNMRVGRYNKEEDYVSSKKEDLNKKEAGRGDKWATAWVGDRKEQFEPKFNQLFAKASGVPCGAKSDAKYTLIFKTTFTEPGFNVGVMRKNAELDGEAWIVETANKDKVVAKILVQKALGRTFGGYDFDTGGRISEAYADAGKALGGFVKSKTKSK